jgi:hypothetical protein
MRRKTHNEKGGQQEISTEIETSPLPEKRGNEGRARKTFARYREINTAHEEWMKFKETLKLRILEKEEEWKRSVIIRVKLKTLAKPKGEEGKMM